MENNLSTLFLICIISSFGLDASGFNIDGRCILGESYWCSSLESAVSCAAVNHCRLTSWKNRVLEKDTNNECVFCENLISSVRQALEDGKTQEEAGQLLAHICDLIPYGYVTRRCRQVVESNTPVIIDIIVAEMEPQMVCSLLGLCNGLTESLDQFGDDSDVHFPSSKLLDAPFVFPTLKSNENLEPICTDCKKFLSDVKTFLGTKSQADIQKLLIDDVCPKMGSYKTQCIFLVKTVLPKFLSLIIKNLDPNMICKELTFCSGGSKLNLNDFELEIDLSFLQDLKLNSSVKCTVCKYVLGAVQRLLTSPMIQTAIETFLNKFICRDFPLCTQEVNAYLPMVFKILSSFMDPGKLCVTLRMCTQSPSNSIFIPRPSETEAAFPDFFALFDDLNLKNSLKCSTCNYVFDEIQFILKSNNTQTFLSDVLKKYVCPRLAAWKDICLESVDGYLSELFNGILVPWMDPKRICHRLCNSSSLSISSSSKSSIVTSNHLPLEKVDEMENTVDSRCDICKAAMPFAQDLIAQNKTQEEIMMTLRQKFCKLYPTASHDVCMHFVKNCGARLIAMLNQQVDPSQICIKLRVCKSHLLNFHSAVGDGQSCVMCQTILQYFEDLLSNPDIVQQAETILKKFCGMLPAMEKMACNVAVDEFIPSFVKIVLTYTPKRVCQIIKVCPADYRLMSLIRPSVKLDKY